MAGGHHSATLCENRFAVAVVFVEAHFYALRPGQLLQMQFRVSSGQPDRVALGQRLIIQRRKSGPRVRRVIRAD